MNNEKDLAALTITPRKTWMPLPHYILVNGQLLGILKKGTVTLSLLEGTYTVTVRSMYKFIESSVTVDVTQGTVTHLTFGDHERLWNILFNIDLVLWLVKRFVQVLEPWDTVYEIVSNVFFAIWLLRLWIIRKKYFRFSIS